LFGDRPGTLFPGMIRLRVVLAWFAVPAVLAPGSPEIAYRHLTDGHRQERLFKGDSALGELDYTWHGVANGDLLLVTTATIRGKVYLDSAVFKRRGFQPSWEWEQIGARTDRFTYDGSRVTRVRTTPDSGVQREQHDYGVPLFNFQELNDLIRSLPLEDGYERILPLYSEGSDTLEMDTVRVVSHTAGTWTLRFADPAIVETYDIDEQSRRIVGRTQVGRKSGSHARYTETY
jgi:hypothetical protein